MIGLIYHVNKQKNSFNNTSKRDNFVVEIKNL